MIDLRALETFLWVAKLGGFGLAARRLHTTQPGISQRIAGLERELGTRLFERVPGRVALTRKGRELLPYAERMLRLRAELLGASGSAEAFRGNVRLGVSETIVHTRLIALVEKIRASYPSITLDIEVDTSQNLRAGLLEGSLDMVFLLGPVAEPDVRNVDFVRYPMAWVASPRLRLPRGPVALRELARWPIITYLKSTQPSQAVRDLLQRAGVPEFKIYGNASLSTIVRLCAEGLGVSVIPPAVIGRELKNRELGLIDVQGGEVPDLHYTISYLASGDTRLLDAVAALALKR